MPAIHLTEIRAVVFDAVGTLLIPHPPAVDVYAAVAREQGVDIAPGLIRDRFRTAFRREEEIDRTANWRTSEAREVERWQRIVAATLVEVGDTSRCFRELFRHFASPSAWTLAPDTAEVLHAAQRDGFVLGMGSNYDSRLCDVVSGFPALAPLRERVVISSQVGYRKPAREFFDEVIRVVGCDPSTILFVGDDLANDCVGAAAAGLRTVLIDPLAPRTRSYPVIASLGELFNDCPIREFRRDL